MKKLFVVTLEIILSLFLFACGNDVNSPQKEGTTPTLTETKVNENHDDHDGHNHAGHNHDTPETVKASPLSPFFGIWKYTGSTKSGWYNNEKWIEFKKDMTFAFGQDGKEIGKGKWFLEDETNYLTIDYDGEDKTKNEHWRAQMNSPVLILIGNTNITKSGEQIKMDKVEERPGVNE